MNSLFSDLRVAGFPGRYIQGKGALSTLAGIVRGLGAQHLIVVSDDTVDKAIGTRLGTELLSEGLQISRLRFGGECTADAISVLALQARNAAGDSVLGLGGGKAIDTAKGIAKDIGVPLIIAPTIASNDSATSRLIVIYDALHRVVAVDYLHRNPDVVLVDTGEIVKAPVRYFLAGIGDALSKRFEVAQCMKAGGLNFFGGRPPETARILAERTYEIICTSGAKAVKDVTLHACTSEVDAVTEATVLLSGLGFESGGLSIAHAMIRGLSAVPALSSALHGEMVAFGTLVQLVLEGRDQTEISQHLRLLSQLGLSATLAALGKVALTEEELETVATLTVQAPYAKNFDRAIDLPSLKQAIIEANRLGGLTRR